MRCSWELDPYRGSADPAVEPWKLNSLVSYSGLFFDPCDGEPHYTISGVLYYRYEFAIYLCWQVSFSHDFARIASICGINLRYTSVRTDLSTI